MTTRKNKNGKPIMENEKQVEAPEFREPEAKDPDDIKIEMMPKYIFGELIKRDKTKGGVFLPENMQDRTPLMRILKIGKDVTTVEPEDQVYINLSWVQGQFQMDGVMGMVFLEDAVVSKLTEPVELQTERTTLTIHK